jgi:hypothetical protein
VSGVRPTSATVEPALIGRTVTGTGADFAVMIAIEAWVMQEVAQQ